MCLNKLALCTYVLLQDVQDRLGGVVSADCGGFLVAFVLGLVCLCGWDGLKLG